MMFSSCGLLWSTLGSYGPLFPVFLCCVLPPCISRSLCCHRPVLQFPTQWRCLATISDSLGVPAVLIGCTMAFSTPECTPSPPDAPPRPEEPSSSAAPPRLRLTVSCQQLAQPMELLVTIDCGASFPPDGSVVLPLGSTVCFLLCLSYITSCAALHWTCPGTKSSTV